MGVLGSAVTGPVVSMNNTNNNNARFQATCWSGIRFINTGTEVGLSRTNVWNENRGAWLDAGNAADVWVERVINSGSLNDLDPGPGRKQLTATISYSVIRTVVGIQSAVVTFTMWDAASGGNILDVEQNTISAEFLN